jgi:hypothetical protein
MLCYSSDEYCCSWVLGDVLCKMYQFVHSLSYTASIFILVVISTERYFAIIHPIKCKQILTPRRLVVSRSWYFEQCSLMLAKCCSLVRQSISLDAKQLANPTAQQKPLRNPVVLYYRVSKSSPSHHIKNKINPIHALIQYFSNIHFNIIIQLTPISSN